MHARTQAFAGFFSSFLLLCSMKLKWQLCRRRWRPKSFSSCKVWKIGTLKKLEQRSHLKISRTKPGGNAWKLLKNSGGVWKLRKVSLSGWSFWWLAETHTVAASLQTELKHGRCEHLPPGTCVCVQAGVFFSTWLDTVFFKFIIGSRQCGEMKQNADTGLKKGRVRSFVHMINAY